MRRCSTIAVHSSGRDGDLQVAAQTFLPSATDETLPAFSRGWRHLDAVEPTTVRFSISVQERRSGDFERPIPKPGVVTGWRT
jgi:hypothetical protein